LWTNAGLNININYLGHDGSNPNRNLLNQEHYLDYISDTESPPFFLLWQVIPTMLLCVITPKANGTYLEQIKNEQETKYKNKPHIPYDIPLSKVYVECIPDMLAKANEGRVEGGKLLTLGDVKIEFGQHNTHHRPTLNENSVFFKQSYLFF
jgi:hypothetical protein